MNDILIGKCKSNTVGETKLWGVIINNTPKWFGHFKQIIGKVAKVLVLSSKLARYSFQSPYCFYISRLWCCIWPTETVFVGKQMTLILVTWCHCKTLLFELVHGCLPRLLRGPWILTAISGILKICTCIQWACSYKKSVMICFQNVFRYVYPCENYTWS